jgi:2-polyprenyl-6-hydroxyphenyl methylase/3-demethylubiquinone-9 3-methyltransferase
MSAGPTPETEQNQGTSNVDPVNLDHFNQRADVWWDPNGEWKTLHHINPVRLDFIKQHVQLEQRRIADIGCGGGVLSESLAKEGAHVLGIDLAPELISVAQAHQHALAEPLQDHLQYQLLSAEDLAEQQPGQFDIVTCMELLEHVPDPKHLLKACAALLKPGGYCFVSTLNRTLKSYLFAIVGAEYLLKLLPQGTHRYDQFIEPAELHNWLRQVGLNPIKMQGMSYNPLTEQAKLSNDISVNYLICAQKKG